MNTAQSLAPPPTTTSDCPEGTRQIIDGRERVMYDGYWIKTYRFPPIRWKPRKSSSMP